MIEKKLPKRKSLSQFLDQERGKGKYIKGDPESKKKSEGIIENEIEKFLDSIPHCAWWNMKTSGQIQSIGNGQAVLKGSPNRGFPDFVACIKGRFIGIEAKACGRYQSPWQIDQQEKIQKKGEGFYFIVTSVRELVMLFIRCGILKQVAEGESHDSDRRIL